MAITYIGAGTASNTAAYASTVTPGPVASTASGDTLLLVAHAFTTGNIGLNGVTTGWTNLFTSSSNATYGTLQAWYLKNVSTGLTMPSVTNSVGSNKFTAQIFAFRGVDPTNPVDVLGTRTSVAAATSWTGSSITSVSASSMYVIVGGSVDDNTWVCRTGPNAVNAIVYTANAASTNDNSIFMAYDTASVGRGAGAALGQAFVSQSSLGADAGQYFQFAWRNYVDPNATVSIPAVLGMSFNGGVSAAGTISATTSAAAVLGVGEAAAVSAASAINATTSAAAVLGIGPAVSVSAAGVRSPTTSAAAVLGQNTAVAVSAAGVRNPTTSATAVLGQNTAVTVSAAGVQNPTTSATAVLGQNTAVAVSAAGVQSPTTAAGAVLGVGPAVAVSAAGTGGGVDVTTSAAAVLGTGAAAGVSAAGTVSGATALSAVQGYSAAALVSAAGVGNPTTYLDAVLGQSIAAALLASGGTKLSAPKTVGASYTAQPLQAATIGTTTQASRGGAVGADLPVPKTQAGLITTKTGAEQS